MAERDPAEARLWLMTLVRLAGIGIATTGLYVIGTAGEHMLVVAGGLLLMAVGATTTLFGPQALRRWWWR